MAPFRPHFLKTYIEKGDPKRSRLIAGVVIAILLLIIAVQAMIILEQKRVNQRIERQSEQALATFLKQGAPVATATGSHIMLRNVRFCWSREICIDTNQLTATANPMNQGRSVIFDDLKSFMVQVYNASVAISPRTLQGMFNESVFNYPGSKLRDLTVGIRSLGSENHVRLTGSLNYFFWIPFEMDTNLNVDRQNNALTISVNTLKVFGLIPATWLIELKPFNLDKLLTLPPNRHLTVYKNLMMVKPFGLFPPPRINGEIASVAVTPTLIHLEFTGNDPDFKNIPQAGAPNFIYVQGGNAQFGHIRMLDTQVQVIDGQPDDFFQFSLLNYLHYLPLSRVQLLEDGGALLYMPDHENIPEPEDAEERSKSGFAVQGHFGRREVKPPERPDFWGRVRSLLNSWFGL